MEKWSAGRYLALPGSQSKSVQFLSVEATDIDEGVIRYFMGSVPCMPLDEIAGRGCKEPVISAIYPLKDGLHVSLSLLRQV